FGVLGFILRRLNYPRAPLVVALVLGAPTEEALRQSLIMSEGSLAIFFQRPISMPIMLVALRLLIRPLLQMTWRAVRARRTADAAFLQRPISMPSMLVALLLFILPLLQMIWRAVRARRTAEAAGK